MSRSNIESLKIEVQSNLLVWFGLTILIPLRRIVHHQELTILNVDICMMKFEVNDIMLWPKLRCFSSTVLSELDRILVCNSGKDLVVMTKDNQLYHYSEHISYSPEWNFASSCRVDVSFTVKQLESCECVLLVLSDLGDLYAWGKSKTGQLGFGSQSNAFKPKLVKRGIELVCCGEQHILALARDGSLWAWGDNQHKQLGIELPENCKERHQNRPVKVTFPEKITIFNVQCEATTSMVLTHSRQILVWGTFGTKVVPRPCFISVPINLIVAQIVLFDTGLLLTSTTGELYTIQSSMPNRSLKPSLDTEVTVGPFPDPDWGLFNALILKRFVRISSDIVYCQIDRFIEPIARMTTQVGSGMAILEAQSGTVYVLQGWNDLNQVSSRSTAADLFALYGSTHDTHRFITLSKHLTCHNSALWANTFNNPCISDVRIKVEGSNKLIYVSYVLLRNHLPTFVQANLKGYRSFHGCTVTLSLVTYRALFAFFRFIYSRQLWIELFWSFELYELACQWDVEDLRMLIMDYSKKAISSQDLFERVHFSPSAIYDGRILDVIALRLTPVYAFSLYLFIYNIPRRKLWHIVVSYLEQHIDQVVILDQTYQQFRALSWKYYFEKLAINIDEIKHTKNFETDNTDHGHPFQDYYYDLKNLPDYN